jgi:hypothetical protein
MTGESLATAGRKAKDTIMGLNCATPRRALMNDPIFDWSRPRRMRRRLVVGLAVLIAVSSGALAATPWIGKYQAVAVMVAALLPMIVAIGYLNASVRGLTGLKTGELDEWQIARRDAAFRQCWWPSIILLGGAGFGAVFLPLAISLKGGVLLAAFFVSLVMPVALLAWTLPDEPAADA